MRLLEGVDLICMLNVTVKLALGISSARLGRYGLLLECAGHKELR